MNSLKGPDHSFIIRTHPEAKMTLQLIIDQFSHDTSPAVKDYLLL